jgi:hypothetical protein
MKNINIKSVLLTGLMILGVSFVSNAQKRMWENRTYNFTVTSNAGNTYLWTTPGLPATLTVNNSTPTTSSLDISFASSSASAVSATLRLTETDTTTTCGRDNDLTLQIFSEPTFTAMSRQTICNGAVTIPSTITITASNFNEFKSITGTTGNLTLTYQLYGPSGAAVSGTGSTGTVTLPVGSTATVNTVDLDATQRNNLQSLLNSQTTTGEYSLRISAVTTNPTTPVSTEAGAVNSSYFIAGNASLLKIIDLILNNRPALNAITPTN